MASKLKAVDPKKAEPSRPKILIYGAPSAGKTWTSLDFPSVYYIDTEGGAALDHYTDKLKKAKGMYLGKEQGSQDFDTVIDQIKALATEDHAYKTLVIDSLSKLYNLEISKEVERLGDRDAFGASKKPATQLTRKLISWLDRIDMNVVVICHEKPLWADQKQLGTTFDAYEKLSYELDLTLNIVKMGETRKALVKKSRLLGFPDGSSFDWSYDEFSKKYGKSIIEKTAEKLVLATSEQLKEVTELLEITKLPENQVDKWFTAAGVTSWAEMDADKTAKIISYIKNLTKKVA